MDNQWLAVMEKLISPEYEVRHILPAHFVPLSRNSPAP